MRTIGVAIPVPQPWGGRLQEYRESIGDPMSTLIPPHITLLPPIDLAPGVLEVVEQHLAGLAPRVPAFEVRLRGTATFRPVSPVIFLVLTEGISGCERLEREVRQHVVDRRDQVGARARIDPGHQAGGEEGEGQDRERGQEGEVGDRAGLLRAVDGGVVLLGADGPVHDRHPFAQPLTGRLRASARAPELAGHLAAAVSRRPARSCASAASRRRRRGCRG